MTTELQLVVVVVVVVVVVAVVVVLLLAGTRTALLSTTPNPSLGSNHKVANGACPAALRWPLRKGPHGTELKHVKDKLLF